MRIQAQWKNEIIEVEAQKIGGNLWVHWKGVNICLEGDNKSKFQKSISSGKASGNILAPMPGKITKVLKKTGDEIKKGEVVVVMEAMKMEYTLKADRDTTINQVNCEVGQQVTLKQLLVSLNEK